MLIPLSVRWRAKVFWYSSSTRSTFCLSWLWPVNRPTWIWWNMPVFYLIWLDPVVPFPVLSFHRRSSFQWAAWSRVAKCIWSRAALLHVRHLIALEQLLKLFNCIVLVICQYLQFFERNPPHVFGWIGVSTEKIASATPGPKVYMWFFGLVTWRMFWPLSGRNILGVKIMKKAPSSRARQSCLGWYQSGKHFQICCLLNWRLFTRVKKYVLACLYFIKVEF